PAEVGVRAQYLPGVNAAPRKGLRVSDPNFFFQAEVAIGAPSEGRRGRRRRRHDQRRARRDRTMIPNLARGERRASLVLCSWSSVRSWSVVRPWSRLLGPRTQDQGLRTDAGLGTDEARRTKNQGL